MRPVIEFALETAMRRGEMLNARWKNLSEDGDILRIPTSKNGEARRIPLSSKARSVLGGIDRNHELLFPVSANAINLAWERLKRSQGIHDLRFHDLRHEAISRLFEKGLTVPEVAAISGHRTPSQLFRYAHADMQQILAKIGEGTS